MQVLQEREDESLWKRCASDDFRIPEHVNLRIHPVRATQGKGLMPDSTSRFSINGKPILHFVRSALIPDHCIH